LDHYFSKCAQTNNPKHILTRDKLPTMLGGIDYKLQKSQFDDLNEELYEQLTQLVKSNKVLKT
jgi:hypothetical protein